MPEYVEVPYQRLPQAVFRALLEEYVTRDGTDYGAQELSLAEKVQRLESQVARADVRLLYDAQSEQWDLVSADAAALLLEE
ncbi:MAG: YheU family protein [Halioglobus sp.]|nr:YheU family protein [Halioglobus sp.]